MIKSVHSYRSFFMFKQPLFLLTIALSSAIALTASDTKNTSTDTVQVIQDQNDTLMFTPPLGWRYADANALPEHVNLMVVGKGAHEFPPSIALGTEIYNGTLKQYLKKIKEINRDKGYEWKDLGTIRTEMGNASISQVDTKTKWGDVRLMHVIIYQNGIIYVVTASALKEEFPSLYKQILDSFRSLKFVKTALNTTDYKK